MENDSRVLLVTFPGQGHINPSLEFAKRLLKMGTKVTFLTGDYALSRMANPTHPLKGLTFKGFSEGLEEGPKLGKPLDEIMDELGKRGYEAVKEIIRFNIEKGIPFSRVVYTTLIPWAGRAAHHLKVPSTFLWIQPATILDIYYYYFNGYDEEFRNHGNDPSWSIVLPGLPRITARDFPSFVTDLSNGNFALPLFKEHLDLLELDNNPIVLVNSFDELEFKTLRAVKNLNLVPIGPLMKDPSDNSLAGDFMKKSDDYIEWLDSKEKSSVIYVSFGSYAELTDKQMEELAKGLIATEKPFLWVIRKGKNSDVLDVEILEKLEKRGKIVEWCSQVEALSHPSLGCFVSHCGWNSSLEALVCGVPLVCLPIWSDQNTNAKLIEDVWETGIRVVKNEEGVVEGSEIKRCVDIVIGNGEIGEKIKINSQKWKNLARGAAKEGGSSYLNLKEFVDQEIRGLLQY